MGLRELVQRETARAVNKALGDIPEVCTYKRATGSAYNPATGTFTRSYSSVPNVKVVFASYSQREIEDAQGRIKGEDQKALIPSLSLAGALPSLSDQIVRPDTSTWEVVFSETDPAQALYKLQIRRPAP